MEKLARTGTGLCERSSAVNPETGGHIRLVIRTDPEAWFAVQTRYRFEKKVAEQLSRKGMDVFLPLRKELRDWSDRRKLLLVPLFPGHAFVHSGKSVLARLLILQTAGVMGFVSLGGTAATVPQKQIDDLQRLLREDIPFSTRPFLAAGRSVRVRGGRLDGVEGLLAEQEKGRLVISIHAIQRSLAIEIQGYGLEMI